MKEKGSMVIEYALFLIVIAFFLVVVYMIIGIPVWEAFKNEIATFFSLLAG